MTKRRDAGSFEHAIMQCIVALGDDEAAEATGRSAAHIRACSDPDQDRVLSLPDAFALDAAMARSGYDPPLLAAWSNALPGETAGAGPDRPPLLRLGELADRFGQLGKTLTTAFADGTLSPREIAAVRDRATALRDEAAALIRSLSPDRPATPVGTGRKGRK